MVHELLSMAFMLKQRTPTFAYDLATGTNRMNSEPRSDEIEFKAGERALSDDKVMISEIELLEHIRIT